MTLEERINNDLKVAMKAKDDVALRGIRAIKSAILIAKTDGTGVAIDEAREVALVQKLIKSRQDSLDIYEKNNREDLAVVERQEIEILKRYLPQMLEGEELENALRAIIAEVGASSAADMGKVMGAATKQLAGKAEGRLISETVKRLLA
ncbi:MAG: GatB/YqeY domain-containing protein [Saprospiraceae bacterium]|jgi:uncharacterized protein YqeY